VIPRSIYAISPSGAVPDPVRIHQAKANLERLGFKVTLDRAALLVHQRFAGQDRSRADAFERAAQSRCGIVMASRGGYGLTRYLHKLDFERLASTGKRWIGLSDFTAFHLAMLATAGAVTWAGPCLGSGFGAPSVDEIDVTTLETFTDTVDGAVEALGFATRGNSGLEAEGILWGGNLTMVCALLGTPFFPQVKGGILFLEDVNEHPFRIERMLTQLLHAGVLQRQKAILFGYMNGYKLFLKDRGFDLPEVYRWLGKQTTTPIVTGLPFGHADPVLTLPHGARVGLAVGRGTCYLVMPHRHGPLQA
jgi:muramoyltetrapeptide carboxypeptidase